MREVESMSGLNTMQLRDYQMDHRTASETMLRASGFNSGRRAGSPSRSEGGVQGAHRGASRGPHHAIAGFSPSINKKTVFYLIILFMSPLCLISITPKDVVNHIIQDH